jgi:hypothetical protein
MDDNEWGLYWKVTNYFPANTDVAVTISHGDEEFSGSIKTTHDIQSIGINTTNITIDYISGPTSCNYYDAGIKDLYINVTSDASQFFVEINNSSNYTDYRTNFIVNSSLFILSNIFFLEYSSGDIEITPVTHSRDDFYNVIYSGDAFYVVSTFEDQTTRVNLCSNI